MTTKDTKDTAQQQGPKADAQNPSGASEEQLRAGENVGKVRGPDIDTSHHVYEFTDPETGEPLETHQVIHDVPVGVNEDGSLKTEKGDKVFQVQDDGADSKQSKGANQGEAGEHTTARKS
jgi:hypothetical protein